LGDEYLFLINFQQFSLQFAFTSISSNSIQCIPSFPLGQIPKSPLSPFFNPLIECLLFSTFIPLATSNPNKYSQLAQFSFALSLKDGKIIDLHFLLQILPYFLALNSFHSSNGFHFSMVAFLSIFGQCHCPPYLSAGLFISQICFFLCHF
jgi:hypothetical protein